MSVDRQKLLRSADQAARKGDLARAVHCYQELIDHFPDDLPLLQRLGDAQIRAGDENAGRTTLVRLAEIYRDKGDRNRSIATLKRAVRLGTPDPEVLSRLGFWLVSGGFAADARAPLHQAAQLFTANGQTQAAIQQYRKIVEASPKDASALESLSQACREMDEGLERAGLSFELSLCFARAGKADAATEFALYGLSDDPDAILRGRLFHELIDICARGGTWAQLTEQDPVASRIVRAWVLEQTGHQVEAEEALLSVGRNQSTPSRLRILVGRKLAEGGNCSAAAEIVVAASEPGGLDQVTTDEALDALALILEQDPRQQAASERMVALSPEPSELPAGAEPVAAEPSRPEKRLTPQVRARLVEAAAMLDHGMPEKALEAIAQLPEEERGGRDATKLARRAETALSRKREELASAEARQEKSPEPVAKATADPSSGDDEWEVSFEEEGDDERRESVVDTAPLRSVPPPPCAATPTETKAPATRPLERLDEELVAAIGQDECETRYQMAIGLVEMGLEDQALPLFNQLCDSGERALDAGLFLLKARVKARDLKGALDAGRRALSATAAGGEEARFQLLALCSQVAYQLGLKAQAQETLAELRTLSPDHPLLGRLESWMGVK